MTELNQIMKQQKNKSKAKEARGVLKKVEVKLAEDENPLVKSEAADIINDYLDSLENEKDKIAIVDLCSQKYGINKKLFTSLKRDEIDKNPVTDLLPVSVDVNDYLRKGYFSIIGDRDSTGYYVQSSGQAKQISNCVLTPLYHIVSESNNRRIVEVTNGVDTDLIEFPSAGLVNIMELKQMLILRAFHLIWGSPSQINIVIKDIGHHFERIQELEKLGWQREGFWAYNNGIFKNKFNEFNEHGIVDHEDEKYFSPSVSSMFIDANEDDDPYENDRYMSYIPSKITLSKWCELMDIVYPKYQGQVGVAYTLACVFRDVVFKLDRNFPHLYCYGTSQSGKSKFAESLSSFFFQEMPAFQLNAGTDFAFYQRLGRFKNVHMNFNEFDDQTIKPQWLQAIKGAFDGEGRERGRGSARNKSETQKVYCGLILMGQKLSTGDGNSITSRSIQLEFLRHSARPTDQISAYDKLKALEKKGITSLITSVVKYRELVAKSYAKVFHRFFNSFRNQALEEIKKEKAKISINDRVLRNYSAMAAIIDIINTKTKLPFDLIKFTDYCYKELMRISRMMEENDELADFWSTFELLISKKLLRLGEHFKIDRIKEIVVVKNSTTTEVKKLGEITQVLYLRLSVIHGFYRGEKKSSDNPLDMSNLTSYLKAKDYYIGRAKSQRFSKSPNSEESASSTVTTAYLINMDKLPYSLGLFGDEFIPQQNEASSKLKPLF